jgi:hypothetical protein
MSSVRQLRRSNHRGDTGRSEGLARLKFIISQRVRSDSTDVHNKAMYSLLVGCSYIIVDFC